VRLSLRGCAWPLTLLLAACTSGAVGEGVERGGRLFRGDEVLHASIRGHAAELPADAARCVNCHRPRAAVGGQDIGTSLGPDVFGPRLTKALPRRGGPPSSYRVEDLCRALRAGVDPALVTLARSMPIYTLSDEDCQALWAFLTQGT